MSEPTAVEWRRIAGRLYAALSEVLSHRRGGHGEEDGIIWPGSVEDDVLKEFRKIERQWKESKK